MAEILNGLVKVTAIVHVPDTVGTELKLIGVPRHMPHRETKETGKYQQPERD